MTPDEVISDLNRLGVILSRATLLRYETQRLISEPKRGALGRGGGRWTEYPDSTPAEAYASWALLHGEYSNDEMNSFFGGKSPKVNPDTVAAVRTMLAKCTAFMYDENIVKNIPELFGKQFPEGSRNVLLRWSIEQSFTSEEAKAVFYAFSIIYESQYNKAVNLLKKPE